MSISILNLALEFDSKCNALQWESKLINTTLAHQTATLCSLKHKYTSKNIAFWFVLEAALLPAIPAEREQTRRHGASFVGYQSRKHKAFLHSYGWN